MKNQDNSNIQNIDKKLSRREYNKRYYQQNREKLLQKKKESLDANVLPLFASAGRNKKALEEKSVDSVFLKLVRILELAALFVLTVAMTYHLIRESAGFYLDANETVFAAYTKAGMIELTAILFSFSRSKNLFLQWGQRIVLVLLCGLSLFRPSITTP